MGKYLPPLYEIFVFGKAVFKNVFDQKFLICQPIFEMFAAHFCDKVNAQLCQQNISSRHFNSCKICAKNYYQTLGNRL